jgi:hypothetical protein
VVVHGHFALPPQGIYRVEIAAPGGQGLPVVASLPEVETAAAEVLVTLDTPALSIGDGRPGEAVALRFV